MSISQNKYLHNLANTILVLLASISINAQMATNPVLWADVPDPDVIRVGDTYYMTSTTMHFNPGVPIMKSNDLVTWETIGYVYNTLANNNNTNLNNGSNMYGKGSWASCLRYANGYFYVYFHSYTTNSVHAYKTSDIESGTWEHATMSGMHDLSVLFDDDGRVWSVYGGPDIQIRELSADGMSLKPQTTNRTLIPNAGSPAGTSFILPGEGAHIMKIDGMYYVFIITWPSGSGRTQVVWRSNSLDGNWEGRVVLNSNGIAQGQIVETPDGKWYGLLFKDNGAVGRIPYLTQVDWIDGWPMMTAPSTLDLPASQIGINGIVCSDDFNYSSPNQLNTAWQWNHNPDISHCSFTDRDGYYRIITSRIDENIYSAKNTLTQRTYGPTSVGITAVDVSNMNNGDFAGLSTFQDDYGFVGVKMVNDTKSIIMVNDGIEIENVPLNQNIVYLRANCNFQNQIDRATFHYSFDGNNWISIGNTVQMSFQLTHFCGYRFALFNYATESIGGYVDFDYFKTGYDINNLIDFQYAFQISFISPLPSDIFVFPTTIPIEVEHSQESNVTHIDFYINNETTPFYQKDIPPYSFEHSFEEAGIYTIKAIAYDNDGNTAESSITILVNPPQAPYNGTPHPIPGKIEFEHYDLGGNGFAYFDTSDENTGGADYRMDEDVDLEDCDVEGGGYNLGWTAAGEWLEYTVNVASTGLYNFTFRVACNGTGRTILLTSNGNLLIDSIEIPDTEGWQVWTDLIIEDIELAAGEQILRLTIGDTDYVNLNYMTISQQSSITKPLQLIAGWNFVGCYIEGITDIEDALSSIWDNVESVKNMDSYFDKNQAEFLNSLTQLKWGQGYLVKVDNSCELDW